ncbi:MAG TPA: hypothetical protein VH370_16515, partial [Humisphaera sp.]|nr:hypothetical protein [Humisphaera sp.]
MQRLPQLRASLFVVGICLLLRGPISQAAGAPRDWISHPAIVEITTTEDIYALGDIHGDYERMIELLAGSNLIDRSTVKP